MSRFNSYEALLGVDAAELERVVVHLNEAGFATDEGGLCLGSRLIEHWSERCTKLLRESGYTGGGLQVTGQHFDHCGAIYILFDAERHGLYGARRELLRAAGRHTVI